MRVRALLLAGSVGCLYPVSSLLVAAPAQAACNLVPTLGDSVYICDSGTDTDGLEDLDGDNSLTMGSNGIVNDDVTFGGGGDTVIINDGSINGAVDQGGGDDEVTMNGGAVTGNIQQGDGTDDFEMTGGQIQSLSQGDNLDGFEMHGGRIVDFFEDGDEAHMTGGRIGRVNM